MVGDDSQYVGTAPAGASKWRRPWLLHGPYSWTLLQTCAPSMFRPGRPPTPIRLGTADGPAAGAASGATASRVGEAPRAPLLTVPDSAEPTATTVATADPQDREGHSSCMSGLGTHCDE